MLYVYVFVSLTTLEEDREFFFFVSGEISREEEIGLRLTHRNRKRNMYL